MLVSHSHFPKFLSPMLSQGFFPLELKKTVEGLSFAVVLMYVLRIILDCAQ